MFGCRLSHLTSQPSYRFVFRTYFSRECFRVRVAVTFYHRTISFDRFSLIDSFYKLWQPVSAKAPPLTLVWYPPGEQLDILTKDGQLLCARVRGSSTYSQNKIFWWYLKLAHNGNRQKCSDAARSDRHAKNDVRLV